MIVYGEREEVVNASRRFQQIQSAADPVDQLIRCGEWESAVLDAICAEADDLVDAYAVVPPQTIRIRPAEGFAYYALYPEQYRDAAVRFWRERQPHACYVIGIRSIGTTLSRVVADALPCPSSRITVRPRGHPFERHLALTPRLEEHLRAHANHWFLVVDEGPGLSGSSFASVADKLNELGIPDERIVFFPSYEPDVSCLVSERARARWPGHPMYFEPFRAESFVPSGARDLSGGGWRELLSCDAAVQPQHERRKYLHEGVLWKFSGLGHYGEARLTRACELAEAGYTPECIGMSNGFLQTRWVHGIPGSCADDELLAFMAQYLAHLSKRYRTGRPADYERLLHMVRVNTGLECDPPDEPGETVALDGRMLPHEWIRTERGWIKTDALDHHDDHFFPGCQEIAWDIAGAAVEWGFDPDLLADRFLSLAQDGAVREKLAFYRTAYLAYRIGYASMAADTLGDTPDGHRFAELAKRYRRLLQTPGQARR